MTNGSILLQEAPALFTHISVLNFEHYQHADGLLTGLEKDQNIQCVVGTGAVDFGSAQSPKLTDFADGVDTLQFLLSF